MAISPSLKQFKSSGVYRLEFDNSQIIQSPSETVRLIIGFSKKGPFNQPVFAQDQVFFKTIFGDIDKALERKGSFFHRTALTCLENGPVICLNLLNLDDDLDFSEFKSLSTAAWQQNSSGATAPVSQYFNRDKFWFSDPDALDQTANNTDYQSAAAVRLLNIANIGRKPITVFTRKSDVTGFSVSAQEYFGNENVPEYMRLNDYVSDFMIDVIVVEGDFSDFHALNLDPVFGEYFDTNGLVKNYVDSFGFERDGLETFLALENVNVLGVYTGMLVPDFISKDGEQLSIQELVNLETSKTGLLLSLNEDEYFDNPENITGNKVDLVGHGIESEEPTSVNFLSYFGTISGTSSYAGSTGITNLVVAGTAGQTGSNALLSASTSLQSALGWTYGYYDTMTIYGPSASLPSGFATAFATPADFTTFRSDVVANQSFIESGGSATTGASANFSQVASAAYNASADTYTVRINITTADGVTGPTDSAAEGFMHILATGATDAGGTASVDIIPGIDFLFASGGIVHAGQHGPLYTAWNNGTITDGDRIIVGATTYGYIDFNRITTNDFTGATFSGVAAFDAASPTLDRNANYLTLDAYEESDFTGSTSIGASSIYVISTLSEDINETLEIWGGTAYPVPTNEVWLDNTAAGPFGLNGYLGKVVEGQHLVMNHGGTGGATGIDPVTGMTRLTRITSVSEDVDPTSSTYKYIKVTTADPILITDIGGSLQIERYKNVESFASHYTPHSLQGYTLRNDQMPNGTHTRENEILDVLTNTAIAEALKDKEVITYRYIVDSFAGTIEPSTKVRLSRLAKARQNVFVIANMPSMKSFRDSTNPLFKLSSTSGFEPRYIAEGGNLSLNPSNKFSLPTINDGSNYIGYYGPNLQIREGGKVHSIPPAAVVSNLYIEKYNLGLPYSIVAGPRRGVISGAGIIGLEYNFDRTDLDYVEPFGYNAILNKRGYGMVINANQTGQQNVVSALSQIHVRELLIYIEEEIARMLENYRWEFNTPQVRLEIKTLADAFMTQVRSDGGVYFFRNIMDSSNNTPEIIDSNFAILDTELEPVRGAGILVHRIRVFRTGAISASSLP